MSDTTVLLTIDPETSTNDAAAELTASLVPFAGDRFIEDIPFDRPEARNARRASFAMVALLAYAKRVGTNAADTEPIQSVIGDLLGDLHHLCDLFLDVDREPLDFDDLVNRGSLHHHAEINGEA